MALDHVIAAAATTAVTPAGPGTGGGTAAAGGDAGFATSLDALLSSVEGSAGEANAAVADMVAGTGDVHTAMLALHRAEVAMQLTVQVRNKLVQAYQDLMRMPI
ncbi:MAG: flagellar hook-basal body complex protein FliE [Vicinamibacterales bacterium]